MFTGIIETTGTIEALTEESNLLRLAVASGRVAENIAVGESVGIDGVCLTVTSAEGNILHFDVMAETLRCTTLGRRRPGDRVNLERALRADSRLGGHFVTGHVDAVVRIAHRHAADNAVEYRFALPAELERFVVPKGSVAVDGISLTVGAVTPGEFGVFLIPHTLEATTLGEKGPGDAVNLEIDLLARYVAGAASGTSAIKHSD